MQFVREITIERFFDVSIILPFYGECTMLEELLIRHYPLLRRNGVEIVIVLKGDKGKEALFALLDRYPHINWLVVHGSKAGLYNCRNKYVLFFEAGLSLITDVIYRLRYILEYNSAAFAVGRVLDQGVMDQEIGEYGMSGDDPAYTLLMAERADLIETNTFDLQERWPFENIRELSARLIRMGKEAFYVPQAVAMRVGELRDYDALAEEKVRPSPVGEVVYDGRCRKCAWQREELLNSFDAFEMASEEIFSRAYPVICLMTVRNEAHQMPDVLLHLDRHCSGIILLDDGSTDGTYERAVSHNLLLKVKKSYKGYFDDLGNRNLLLQLGYLFQAEWFLFMDADERFDDRYPKLIDGQPDMSVDSVLFRMIHLWDDTEHYRKDVPQSIDGVLFRFRMFRNKGFTQIVSAHLLHFPAIPFIQRYCTHETLLLHYGLMESSTRQAKYNRYMVQDKDGKQQGFGYDYLVDGNACLGKVKELHPE